MFGGARVGAYLNSLPHAVTLSYTVLSSQLSSKCNGISMVQLARQNQRTANRIHSLASSSFSSVLQIFSKPPAPLHHRTLPSASLNSRFIGDSRYSLTTSVLPVFTSQVDSQMRGVGLHFLVRRMNGWLPIRHLSAWTQGGLMPRVSIRFAMRRLPPSMALSLNRVIIFS